MKREREISTKNMDRKCWLALRRSGIGGSDAGVIMGANKYKSIFQLYEEKTGLKPIVDEENEYTYWGNVMEPIVRKEFSKRTGMRVRQKHAMIFHDELSFLFADLDGLVKDEHGEKCLFEAKTASEYKSNVWADGYDETYYWQLQHYMAVTGLRKAYICALVGGNHFVYHTVLRNDEDIERLLEKEKVFWECVRNHVPPEADGSEATSKYLGEKFKSGNLGSIELGKKTTEALSSYDEINSQIEKLQSQKTLIENQIKAEMGNHEIAHAGDRTVTWKRSERTLFDSKLFKEEQPSLFENYSKKTSYRRLCIA